MSSGYPSKKTEYSLPEMLIEVLFILTSNTGVSRPELDRIIFNLDVDVAKAQNGTKANTNEQNKPGMFGAETAHPSKK